VIKFQVVSEKSAKIPKGHYFFLPYSADKISIWVYVECSKTDWKLQQSTNCRNLFIFVNYFRKQPTLTCVCIYYKCILAAHCFPNWKSIQLILGRNIADRILRIVSQHRKVTPNSLSILSILMSHSRHFLQWWDCVRSYLLFLNHYKFH